MVRRRACITHGETSENNAGSSLYSRQTTIHMATPCLRISAGSTRSSRSFSHSWRISVCSRSGGSISGPLGAVAAAFFGAAGKTSGAIARSSRALSARVRLRIVM